MERTLLNTLAVLILAVSAHAQQSQTAPAMTLTGAVYDINGSVIVRGTRVVARGADGKLYEAGVNEEGVYALKLPLGVYTVQAGADWFCPSEADGFRVVNATHGKMSLDFVLEGAGSHTPCRHKPLVKAGAGRKAKRQPKTGTE